MAFAKIIPFLSLACLLHFGGYLPASAQQYRDRPARTLSYLFGSSKTSTTAAAPTTSSQGLPPPPDPPAQISPAQLPSINPVLRTPQLHLPQQRHHPQLIHQQPNQPILYNIRFYPDLSYQQASQDRVKDKPSGYSFQQAQPQPSPVCPYANHHQYVTKIPAPEDVSSLPAKQQTFAAPTQPAPTQPAPTPASPPAPAFNSISPTAFTPKLLNTRPQQEAQPAGNNYILPLEPKRHHQSPLQQQQPYVMTQQHGASSVYLPVLQAAAAAVSQQHQLAQFFQPHHQPYYQPPQPQFPYYSQQLFASQQHQFQQQRGQQQVSSQKLAPSVYNEYPQYYYYPEYVYVVPVLPQSSQQKQEQLQYPYSVQSFNSNWNTVEDMKRLREEQQKQKQQQPQVKPEKQ